MLYYVLYYLINSLTCGAYYYSSVFLCLYQTILLYLFEFFNIIIWSNGFLFPITVLFDNYLQAYRVLIIYSIHYSITIYNPAYAFTYIKKQRYIALALLYLSLSLSL